MLTPGTILSIVLMSRRRGSIVIGTIVSPIGSDVARRSMHHTNPAPFGRGGAVRHHPRSRSKAGGDRTNDRDMMSQGPDVRPAAARRDTGRFVPAPIRRVPPNPARTL